MTTEKRPHALVIGSGIAGLASAIRLAIKGYSVSVYEANAEPGGKLRELRLGDYRFDAGPSLFTLPHLVDELFVLAKKKPSDYFEYERCPITCNYFFEDGTFLPFDSDWNRLSETIETTLGTSAIPLKRKLAKSAFLYEKTHEAFMESSLHLKKTYLSKAVLKCLLALPKLEIFLSMHASNKKQLNHDKLVQVFDRYATYNGSNPYRAPGILNVIPHLEHGIGTYFPKGGMYQIVRSLVGLAEELGVTFNYNKKVERIIHTGNKIRGIKVGESIIEADLVFCNMDVRLAYKQLLGAEYLPKKIKRQELSSSAMIFYWGVKQKISQLDLHNIFFSSDYKEEFKQIFDSNMVSYDPTVYIHVSSKKNPSDAPTGKENWFVMVNVPANSGQDWFLLREEIRRQVLSKLSRLLKCDIEAIIEEEDYLDPIRIEERTLSYAGALYGASSNKRLSAFFRHSNFSKIKGLYFVGGTVHPGGGIPLCLLSAKISCNEVGLASK